MVANNFLGRCNNFEINRDLAASSPSKVFKSFKVSEKRATSAADTIADENKKNTIPILPKSSLVSMVEKKVRLGSGSNGICVS